MDIDGALDIMLDGAPLAEVVQSLIEQRTYGSLFRNTTVPRKRRAREEVKRVTLKRVEGTLHYKIRMDPSVENKTHRGFVQPLGGKKVRVWCSCKDYKFRWEVANYKAGSSVIVSSNGADPEITNPEMIPALCKHLAVVRREVAKEVQEKKKVRRHRRGDSSVSVMFPEH